MSQEERNHIPETYICIKEKVKYAISRIENSFAGKDEFLPRLIKKHSQYLKSISQIFLVCACIIRTIYSILNHQIFYAFPKSEKEFAQNLIHIA